LTLGSANLNEHSMFNDTEVNLVSWDPALARDTRVRLWSEHLGISHAELGASPARIIDEVWRPVAFEQRRRQEAGLAPTHALMRLPHVSKRSMRLLGPLQGLLVDG
jgi:phosphatidylserine/phosphatidylglycerophosphate/cardiolipin synthase-like enzyme